VSEGEGILQVEGSVTSEAEREQVFRKIRRIQPLTRILLAIGKDSDPTLHFKIFLLETRKDLSGSVGIPWPAEFSKSSPLRPLELLFRALSEKGTVRILSSPELSVKCPGKAELFAGGEIPIRQRNRFNETVQWKNVGLSLRLDVLEFKKDRIRLSIETELSHLASELQNDQIPGLRSNRIRTEVEGALDRPLLLSGLLQEDLREQARGFPGLSSVPVLGSLFGSSDFQDRKTELSAVLLPQGSPAASPMKSIDPGAPDGWIPPFRNRIPAFELEQLRKSAEFPWNVL
jgi:pilus assembly protein CpaC